MQLGEMLIAKGLVTQADIDAALERQVKDGGRLGENLVALGVITADQIASVLNSAPAIPGTLQETGINERSLMNLMLKFMHVEACETILELAERMKIPRRLIQSM